MTLAQFLTEKNQEVKKLTQELQTLQTRIVNNWQHYDNMGRRYGYRCRECLRVLPIIRADEAQNPIMTAKLKTAQDSLNFLLFLANAILQSLPTPPLSNKIQSTQKVLKSIDLCKIFLKTSLEKFALGFAAGAVGAKALSKIANTQTAQNLAIKSAQLAQNLANYTNKTNQNLAQNLSTKTLQMLAKQSHTNPRANAVLEKMQVSEK